MRILLTTAPMLSHLYLLVPLAWALRAEGHEVLTAVQHGFADPVLGAGLPVVEHTPPMSVSQAMAVDRAGRPVEWTADLQRAAQRAARGFARVSAAAAEDTVALVRDWRPDLVISDPCEFAGPMAAAAHGIPWVTYEWGVPLDPAFLPAAADELAPEREHLGLTGAPLPALVLDNRPPSLRPEHNGGTHAMRYIPYNGCATVPPWLLRPPRSPRICVTVSTFASADSELGMLKEVLVALAGLGAEVVVGGNDDLLAELGGLPDGVRVMGWLPLQLVFPTCAVAIHHGGLGSLLTSLYYGLPQLVLPAAGYDLAYAEMITGLSAGLWLDPYTLTAAQVRSSVAALLHAPVHRDAARGLAAEIAAQPTPADVVPVLERLAATRR